MIDNVREQMRTYLRNLQVLKEQSRIRIDVPQHILNEINDIEKEIARLEAELAQSELALEIVQDNRLTVTTTITNTTNPDQPLTPKYLSNEIAPYLNAITAIQNVIDEIKGQPHEVLIRSITQSSPIEVNLTGVAEVMDILDKRFTPWKQKHAQQMARYEELKIRTEIENKQCELLQKQIAAQNAQLLQAKQVEQAKLEIAEKRMELEERRLALEEKRLALEEKRLELHRGRIQLALDILSEIEPNLNETDRIEYVMRLLPHLETITESNLEVGVNRTAAEGDTETESQAQE